MIFQKSSKYIMGYLAHCGDSNCSLLFCFEHNLSWESAGVKKEIIEDKEYYTFSGNSDTC